MIGERFGSWVVLRVAPKTKPHIEWVCKCDCGRVSLIRGTILKNGKSKKCASCSLRDVQVNNKIHGMVGTPEYFVWNAIVGRCTNPKSKNYKNYGGRGITMCDRWRASFTNFFEDMGYRPSPELSIERIDNSKGYYKENCKWATAFEQAANRRSTVYVEHNGERMILADWARRLNTGITSIKQMQKRGKSFQEIINYYSQKQRRKEVEKLLLK